MFGAHDVAHPHWFDPGQVLQVKSTPYVKPKYAGCIALHHSQRVLGSDARNQTFANNAVVSTTFQGHCLAKDEVQERNHADIKKTWPSHGGSAKYALETIGPVTGLLTNHRASWKQLLSEGHNSVSVRDLGGGGGGGVTYLAPYKEKEVCKLHNCSLPILRFSEKWCRGFPRMFVECACVFVGTRSSKVIRLFSTTIMCCQRHPRNFLGCHASLGERTYGRRYHKNLSMAYSGKYLCYIGLYIYMNTHVYSSSGFW
jgi:hypothetical protein